MIVLDTHAWVWWVNDPTLLGAAAWQAVDAAGLDQIRACVLYQFLGGDRAVHARPSDFDT